MKKKRRKDYGDILLELWSVWEQRKLGWLFTCRCNYIVYTIMSTQKVYLLPVLLLKKAWLTNSKDWLKRYKIIDANNRTYTTKSIAIPTETLLRAISDKWNSSIERITKRLKEGKVSTQNIIWELEKTRLLAKRELLGLAMPYDALLKIIFFKTVLSAI